MQVGDKVWIKQDRGELYESTILKIGSKYIHTKHGKFAKNTLIEIKDWGIPAKMYLNKETYEKQLQESKLSEELSKIFSWKNIKDIPLDKLIKIKSILEEK
jgi:hypothetical protein